MQRSSLSQTRDYSKAAADAARRIAASATPAQYVASLGIEPFDWQVEELRPIEDDRVLLLCARQSGKSTVAGAETVHVGKHRPRSLALIVCPSKDQSEIVMGKVDEFITHDAGIPRLRRDAVYTKEFANKSTIHALPGTERSVRGYSNPDLILLDEASRVPDETYMAVRPMMTGGGTKMIAATTAFGKRGWFYRAWTNPDSRWRKILVRVAWEPHGTELVPAMPEDEFRAYWASRGVSAYYSTRHRYQDLLDDLIEMGEQWFRQEYCCEFLDREGSLFAYDDIMAAFREEHMEALVKVGLLGDDDDEFEGGSEALKLV